MEDTGATGCVDPVPSGMIRAVKILDGTKLTLALALAGCGGTVTPAGGGADAAAADVVAADVADLDVASASDAAVAEDAAAPPDVPRVEVDAGPALPIEAPAGQWTWVPVEGARCGNGSGAGIGINPSNTSQDLVIFLMGGGGCWDGLTCLGVPVAAHINEDYSESLFRADLRGVSGGFVFSRTNQQNPYRDATQVFVPYCTGDIHGGDAEHEYTWGARRETIHHVGARNMALYLRRLAATYPQARRVTVMGISAGGFGAGLNWWRVADAFPAARTDLIDDSGPPFRPPQARWELMRDAWNIQFPAACTTCRDDLETLLDFYAARFPPPARMALLSYTRDTTISTYFGITQDDFTTGLMRLARERIAPRPNMRHFIVPGASHVLMGGATRITGGGVTLAEWINRMASDSPDWANVAP